MLFVFVVGGGSAAAATADDDDDDEGEDDDDTLDDGGVSYILSDVLVPRYTHYYTLLHRLTCKHRQTLDHTHLDRLTDRQPPPHTCTPTPNKDNNSNTKSNTKANHIARTS